jgi:hypothetical protein
MVIVRADFEGILHFYLHMQKHRKVTATIRVMTPVIPFTIIGLREDKESTGGYGGE